MDIVPEYVWPTRPHDCAFNQEPQSLTKREYFAAKFMSALLSGEKPMGSDWREYTASEAIRLTDVFIELLNETISQ